MCVYKYICPWLFSRILPTRDAANAIARCPHGSLALLFLQCPRAPLRGLAGFLGHATRLDTFAKRLKCVVVRPQANARATSYRLYELITSLRINAQQDSIQTPIYVRLCALFLSIYAKNVVTSLFSFSHDTFCLSLQRLRPSIISRTMGRWRDI